MKITKIKKTQASRPRVPELFKIFVAKLSTKIILPSGKTFQGIIMHVLFLIAFSIFSSQLLAENATNFTCTGPDGTLFIQLEQNSNELILFNYFDGITVWLADSVNRENLNYNLRVFRPHSAASGVQPARAITQIKFLLPKDRQIRRIQTGGYYFPIFTTYPVEFVVTLVNTLEDNSRHEVNLTCTGN